MVHYDIWFPDLLKLNDLVKALRGVGVVVNDLYNLARDPRVLSIATSTELTVEQIELIHKILPFRVVVKEVI